MFADAVVGWSSEPELVEPIFRAVDHDTAKRKLSSSSEDVLKRVGASLGRLQEKRHKSDYAPPAYNPSRAEALDVIQQAREAIALIESLDRRQRRLIVTALIGKAR